VATPPAPKGSGLRATWADLSPLQRIAVLGIAVMLVVWIATNRIAPELITAFGGMIAIEEGRKAIQNK